jgi:hypothetical protein
MRDGGLASGEQGSIVARLSTEHPERMLQESIIFQSIGNIGKPGVSTDT